MIILIQKWIGKNFQFYLKNPKNKKIFKFKPKIKNFQIKRIKIISIMKIWKFFIQYVKTLFNNKLYIRINFYSQMQ